MTWKEKYRRDPDLAESIIETLRQDLKDAEKRIEMLELALERIVICDWPGPYPEPIIRNRADWMQEIAKEALK
jgi:hypothetical protein